MVVGCVFSIVVLVCDFSIVVACVMDDSELRVMEDKCRDSIEMKGNISGVGDTESEFPCPGTNDSSYSNSEAS